MIGRNRNRADDELPDAVVRMYREALDDDGLDFLRRGPRTAAERLAYAQRVHPEAFRTAQPAPAPVQAAFAERGSLDGRQHFVGPDRTLYVRGETTTEPLHSSIRRGFETAVPGFRPAGLGQALAEVEMLRGGGGADQLAGDESDDGLAPEETAPAGWNTAYPAGRLRMEEIASRSQDATPADALGLDASLRKDILRHLWYESDRGRLTPSQHAFGQAAYGGIEWKDKTPMPHSPEMEAEFLRRVFDDPLITDAEENWPSLSHSAKQDALRRIVHHLSDVFGFSMPEVAYAPLDRGAGVYDRGRNSIIVDSSSAKRAADFEGPMSNATHEGLHALQKHFGDLWSRGHLQAADPNYAAGEWAALTEPFYIPPDSNDLGPYKTQLREYWADRLKKALACEFQRRITGEACLESPP